MQPNARFWVWWNGPVKITLHPGQRLSACRGSPTEEGWYQEWMTLYYLEGMVSMVREHHERDCDGRVDTGEDLICSLNGLRQILDEDDGSRWPRWTPKNEWQRDYEAEKAGY